MQNEIYNAKDIAQHILVKKNITNALKLQKLLFFGQSISLYVFDKPLFSEPIEAWKDGPVVSTVYGLYKHNNKDLYSFSNRCDIDDESDFILDVLINFFGKKRAMELRNLTHRPNGAWSKVYEPNKNNKIPYELIKTEMNFYKELTDYINKPVEVNIDKVSQDIKNFISNCKVV